MTTGAKRYFTDRLADPEYAAHYLDNAVRTLLPHPADLADRLADAQRILMADLTAESFGAVAALGEVLTFLELLQTVAADGTRCSIAHTPWCDCR